MRDTTVAIVGLGLIGGSLARDLAARGVHVLGFDRDADTLAAATADGAVHGAISPSLEELGQVDLLVLAVPVTDAQPALEAARPRLGPRTVMTDVGSTTRSIQTAADRLGVGHRFVGSHPLAGDHRPGWAASRTGLFAGARTILCPGPATAAAALDTVSKLWREVGAETVTMSAAAHDELVAMTSHLPQLAAYALAATLADDDIGRQWLAAGGRDTLRLAASPVPLWVGIALDNADHLLPALAHLRNNIKRLEDALGRHDDAALSELFADGKDWYAGPARL